MRILADENVPGDVVRALRRRGHDVAWVAADKPGARDNRVLETAQAQSRILVTFDKDFGELAFRWGLPASSGIVLFRTSLPSPSYVARLAVTALESRADWRGHFAVVEDDRIRMTPLPGLEEL